MPLGLKLWSSNTGDYYREARKLYAKGLFDYIELYVVPGTLHTLSLWADLDIPFALHAPHFMHGVNLAECALKKKNMMVFKEVDEFYKTLSPLYVVVHGGVCGTVAECARQISTLYYSRLLIENKPYVAPYNLSNRCCGATIEEIEFLTKETGCGFCLDIGHAICSANSQKLSPYAYLEAFGALGPCCYHLSDGFINSVEDKHLHFGQGDFDFGIIRSIIDAKLPIAIETVKDSTFNLNDFISDIEFFNG